MMNDFYIDELKSIARYAKEEIDHCNSELETFARINLKDVAAGRDNTINLEIKSTLMKRKEEAENELRAIRQGLLDIERQFFGGAVHQGTEPKGREARTLNIDPACLE
jgi:hypothetical protein